MGSLWSNSSYPPPDVPDPHFTWLRESGQYADLKLTCNGKTWLAHRSVVCPQSDFLRASCDGPFLEAKSGVIELDPDEVDIVDHILDFLYEGNYYKNEHSQPSTKIAKGLLLHLKVYAAGHKYFITGLKTLAEDKLSSHWYQLVDLSHLREVVDNIYTTSQHPEALYQPLTRLVHSRWEAYMKEPEFERILDDYPEFAKDLLLIEFKHQKSLGRVAISSIWCGNCQSTQFARCSICNASHDLFLQKPIIQPHDHETKT